MRVVVQYSISITDRSSERAKRADIDMSSSTTQQPIIRVEHCHGGEASPGRRSSGGSLGGDLDGGGSMQRTKHHHKGGGGGDDRRGSHSTHHTPSSSRPSSGGGGGGRRHSRWSVGQSVDYANRFTLYSPRESPSNIGPCVVDLTSACGVLPTETRSLRRIRFQTSKKMIKSTSKTCFFEIP